MSKFNFDDIGFFLLGFLSLPLFLSLLFFLYLLKFMFSFLFRLSLAVFCLYLMYHFVKSLTKSVGGSDD